MKTIISALLLLNIFYSPVYAQFMPYWVYWENYDWSHLMDGYIYNSPNSITKKTPTTTTTTIKRDTSPKTIPTSTVVHPIVYSYNDGIKCCEMENIVDNNAYNNAWLLIKIQNIDYQTSKKFELDPDENRLFIIDLFDYNENCKLKDWINTICDNDNYIHRIGTLTTSHEFEIDFSNNKYFKKNHGTISKINDFSGLACTINGGESAKIMFIISKDNVDYEYLQKYDITGISIDNKIYNLKAPTANTIKAMLEYLNKDDSDTWLNTQKNYLEKEKKSSLDNNEDDFNLNPDYIELNTKGAKERLKNLDPKVKEGIKDSIPTFNLG